MIEIECFHSGSSGNLYRLKSGAFSLVLECGVIQSVFSMCISYDYARICGVLISHEHMDHAKCYKQLLARGIPLWMSRGTADSLGISGANFVNILKAGVPKRIPGSPWTVHPIELKHDAAEPLGFIISDGEDVVLFATDTYCITQAPEGLTYAMLECNYVKEVLDSNIEHGFIQPSRAKRIYKSHMELNGLLLWLQRIDRSKLKKIFVIHLSEQNADARRIKKEIEQATGVPVELARK